MKPRASQWIRAFVPRVWGVLKSSAVAMVVLQSTGCSLIYDFTRSEVCGDGIDNDGNEKTDCADPACFGESCAEVGAFCRDGQDNDGDGETDCTDRDCEGLCPEDDVETCTDERDNDGDGLRDGADPRCWSFRQLRQTSCLSTDPVHLSVSLWDLPPDRTTARSSDGQLEYRSEILDGDWQKLDVQLWLRSPLDPARGASQSDFVDADFQNIEISLVPSTPGEDIPLRLEEHGLFTIRLKPSKAIVTLPNQEVTTGWPEHIRLFDGRIWILERGGKVESRMVELALPEFQPARLVIRSVAPALAVPAHRLLDDVTGCRLSLDWSLDLDAPGRLPCGRFSPDRGLGELGLSCRDESLPAAIPAPHAGRVAAAGLAPRTTENFPRGDDDICSFDPDTAEFPGDPPKGLDVASVSWRPGGWRLVAWGAGRQLFLATSRDCRSWSAPQVIYADDGRDRELGVPSWIPEGTFAHPPPEDAVTPTKHPEQVLFSANEGGGLELLSLRREHSGDWSPAPERVYAFTQGDRDDLVAEPIRAVTLGEHELALVVRIRQSLQSSVGILLATRMDTKTWSFARADPWPFRAPSGNPSLLDAIGLSGAVSSYQDGKGWLFIDGDPEDNYPIVGGDHSGLVLLDADLSGANESTDGSAEGEELGARTAPLSSTFPEERLVGVCNADDVCDPFESCAECPIECTCRADLLMQGCWDAPVLKDKIEVSADLTGDFVLRGRIVVPRDPANRSCRPWVRLRFGEDDQRFHGLSFSGQPTAFDDDEPPRTETIPTIFSEWTFEMERAGDSLIRRVYSPTGCQVVDFTLDLQGAGVPELELGSSTPCNNVVLRQLELLDVSNR